MGQRGGTYSARIIRPVMNDSVSAHSLGTELDPRN